MHNNQEVWIIPDEAKVVRYSELLAIYLEVGSLRATADAIGSSAPTVMRHLKAAGVDTSREKNFFFNEEIGGMTSEN